MILEGVFAIELGIGWRELEEYLKTTEKYLEKARTEWEAWFDEQTKHLTPEERNEIGESYSDTYWDYAETFPRILRNSFFVSAYSLLEHKMAIICRWLKKDKQIPISWSDLRGGTLDQFKNYCKLASLDLTYADQNWKEINDYRRIRNCIVHNRGLIKGSREERDLRDYITPKGIISQDTIEEEIALTEQFCKEVTKTIWRFLSKVIEAYKSQSQKPKRGV
jgi:hypothetical protein